ncbi:hypothetical protein PQI65_07105 [Brachybacterium paraconglomeratum]
MIGPSSVGTGAAVATAMVIEPLLAGRRAILFGRADAPHTLTHVPDLAAAMLHGICGLWYGPCAQVPGRLKREEGLVTTSWEDAVGATVRAAQGARDTKAVSVAP